MRPPPQTPVSIAGPRDRVGRPDPVVRSSSAPEGFVAVVGLEAGDPPAADGRECGDVRNDLLAGGERSTIGSDDAGPGVSEDHQLSGLVDVTDGVPLTA